MFKDWIGSKRVLDCNIRKKDAEPNDYYATEPRAIELLLDLESFSDHIWEPACGEGHLSKVLEKKGYNVYSTDLIERGYDINGKIFSYKCWE